MAALERQWLAIGKIVAAQGLQGEVRVYPDSDFPERFLEPGRRWLQRPGQPEPEPVELEGGYFLPGKGLYAIALAGIDDRDAAEDLRGATLLVPEGDRLPLEEDEYHVLDLVGLTVFDRPTGERIGIVTDIFSAGHDLLEVELDAAFIENKTNGEGDKKALNSHTKKSPKRKSRRCWIPFAIEIVPVVDLDNKRIEIDPPEGLLELAL